MAMNNYFDRVKLISADSGLEAGEYVTAIDIDVTTVRDVPQPVSLYVATLCIVGSST